MAAIYLDQLWLDFQKKLELMARLQAHKTDLYLKRCFLLAREEYVELGKIEKDIAELID